MTAPAAGRRKLSLAHPIPPPSGHYRWIYLWQWPIRAMHWAAALSIVVLVVTGFYIGRPYFAVGGETASGFLMGWVRFLHFLAAAVLVATAIVRLWWLFAGNRFERWPALFPVRPRDWGNLVRQVKYYLMIRPEKAPHYLGHNPLQQLSYTALYGVALVQVVTGFALYGQSDPNGAIYALTNWLGPAFGGMPVVRFTHHVLTWVFLIFVPIHVYLALRADVLERTGSISSIVSGGRFVPADQEFEDD
jgi:Ni/Fe-hydrogenase b-type cytochrome subunit